LKSFLADANVDILHVHDIQSARAVFQLNRQYKIILDLHENRPEIMKHYSHVNSLRGKLLISPEKWRSFEKKYIEQAYRVVVVTEPAKRHYVEMTRSAPDKFIVVPNTIRKAFYETPSYHEEIISKYKDTLNLLYLGDTGLRRGTLELIQALAIVRTKITKVKLIMVGKSQEDEILKQEIARLNLQNHVELTGWQNFETFQSYLKVSKIGFSPLHRNLHHDTTFANKIFQYLSFGLPIVVSDATAQKEVVEQFNCGYSYPANNVQALAECILKLYEDPENYQRMSEQAILAVRTKYNWETTSAELISFYANLSSQVPCERHLEPNH
jgi:glycosyltransferase involved in cell wall biosynthesis